MESERLEGDPREPWSSAGIGTFDFAKARAFLSDEKGFHEASGRVGEWVEKFAMTVRWNETAELSRDVWSQAESDELRKMMRQVGRIYRRHHAKNLIHCRKAKLWVSLSSLAEKYEPQRGRPDEVYYELHFEAAEAPVYAHRLLLSSRIQDPFDGRYSVRLQQENGETIPVELLPSFSEESDQWRELIAWFHEPVLPGSGVVCLTMVDHGRELMGDLRDPDGGCDFLGLKCPLGKVGVIQLGCTRRPHSGTSWWAPAWVGFRCEAGKRTRRLARHRWVSIPSAG